MNNTIVNFHMGSGGHTGPPIRFYRMIIFYPFYLNDPGGHTGPPLRSYQMIIFHPFYLNNPGGPMWLPLQFVFLLSGGVEPRPYNFY